MGGLDKVVGQLSWQAFFTLTFLPTLTITKQPHQLRCSNRQGLIKPSKRIWLHLSWLGEKQTWKPVGGSKKLIRPLFYILTTGHKNKMKKNHHMKGKINNPKLIIKEIQTKHENNYKIIKELLQTPYKEITVTELAQKLKTSNTPLLNKLRTLREYELVTLTKKHKKPTKAKLNTGGTTYENTKKPKMPKPKRMQRNTTIR